MTSGSKQVFISYGRADALDLAKRLAADLDRARFRVWLDLQNIEQGGVWEVRIEQGLRNSSLVVALMTPQSVREQSICRDEIVFALNSGKKVVPIRAHRNVQPTLMLCRRNWIDFTESYDQGFASLLRCLAGDDSALRPPPLPTVTGMLPIDFGPEIARYSQGFEGRSWLVSELDRWLSDENGRMFVIVGEPGIGKSAIAAWLGQRPDVLGIHFCTQRNTRTLNPYEFVASLVTQMHARLPSFPEVVEPRQPELSRATAADAFRELIVEPTRMLDISQPLLLIVDSLDEAAYQPGEKVVDVLAEQVPDLPSWMRVVATTRSESLVLDRVRSMTIFPLKSDEPNNQEDIRQYLQTRLSDPAFAVSLNAPIGSVVDRIAVLAEGNFLYARLTADALEREELSVADMGALTAGLSSFYAYTFRRRFRDVDVFSLSYAPLLRALAVARGPLPFPVLQRVIDEDAEIVHRRLRELRPYLSISVESQPPSYSLFHKSLQDWLTSPDDAGDYWLDASKGHLQLANVLSNAWSDDVYALRHLPAHLVGSGRGAELRALLLDLGWMQRKLERLGIVSLLGDYTLIQDDEDMRLVQSALTNAAHGLARDTSELRGQLVGRLSGRGGSGVRHLLEQVEAKEGTWLRPVSACLTPAGGPLLQTLTGHTWWVEDVAITPNGALAVSACDDKTLKVWDLSTGAEVHSLMGHEKAVSAVVVTSDGTRAISAAWDNTIRIWNLETGEPERIVPAQCNGINTLALTPDETQLLSAGNDGRIQVWDTRGWTEATLLEGHEGSIYCVAIAVDGTTVVSCGADGVVRVWDLVTGEQTWELRGHTAGVNSVSISPDGARVISASDDHTLMIWDLQWDGRVRPLVGHTAAVNSVALVPGAARVVSASDDHTVRVWDLDAGTELEILGTHAWWVRSVAVSPDGRRAVSASADLSLKVWDLLAQGVVSSRAETFGYTNDIALVAGGTQVTTAHEVREGKREAWLQVWDLQGQAVRRLGHHLQRVSALAASGDGGLLVASSGTQVEVWDIRDKVLLETLTGHTGEILDLAVSTDGSRAVSAARDGTVRVWDLRGGRELYLLRGRTDVSSQSMSMTADGRLVVSAEQDGTLSVWDLEDGRSHQTFSGHLGGVDCVTFTHGGTRVLSTGGDSMLRVWDVSSGCELYLLRGHTGGVTSLSVAPDDRWAASSGFVDHSVRIWDLKSGTEAHTLQGHTHVVAEAAFVPGEALVVSVGWDHACRLWNIHSGALVGALTTEAGLTCCVVCPDGRTIVAGDQSGQIVVLCFES